MNFESVLDSALERSLKRVVLQMREGAWWTMVEDCGCLGGRYGIVTQLKGVILYL